MKHLLGVAAACMGVAVAILLLSWTSYFSQLNSSAYDFTLRVVGELPPASPTLIVAIDDESLTRGGTWPWSRGKLAQLVDRVQAGGPLAIGMDMLVDDPGPDEAADDELAAAISRAKAMVLATHIAPGASNQWLKPNSKFLQPHVRLGHVHTDLDFDGVLRKVYSAKVVEGGTPVPAFALEVLHAAGLVPQGDFEQQSGGVTILRPQPINIRFIGGRQSFPHVSAVNVIEGAVAAERFKDRIVLIGYTAEGLDQWLTPFSGETGTKTSGVEVHANMIDTFFAGQAISEVPQPVLLAGLFLIVFFLWWLDRHRHFEGVRFYVFAVLMLPGAAVGSWALMKFANLWFAFPPFWVAILLVVPGLEVLEIARVNQDLDRKLRRLTEWDETFRHKDHEWDAQRSVARKHLLSAPQQNARWRLQAVDFFNEDLVRFLTFNKAILGSIEDVIIVADPAGRVVYQNPAAQRMEGFSTNPPLIQEYLASLLDGRRFDPNTSDLTFVRSRGGKHYYHLTQAPIAQSGVVISLHDSTAQYELAQAKNDMVSLVSHELRTPLTSIRGYTDMLVKYDLVAEKGKPFLATIIEESRRLNGLIQAFLDIAYIESGRQKITATEFEVEPLLKDMMDILGPLAAEKQIRIEPPPTAVTRVRADRLLLYQAISNLVTNAIKYSPPGTTVHLNVSNGNGQLRFQVLDEGCGIPSDEAAKVFEKFYRRANRETREQSGFGLGLAFVKEVAVKHGGDVFVESQEGKGSAFTLWIPGG